MDRGPTGRGLTLDEFRRLVEQLNPRQLNRRVLRLVGLEMTRGDIRWATDGRPAALEDAHAAIQQDAAAQRALYQLAMDLWR